MTPNCAKKDAPPRKQLFYKFVLLFIVLLGYFELVALLGIETNF